MNPLLLFMLSTIATEPTDHSEAGCHAVMEARCDTLRAGDALRCRIEADAQCDITDAELFVAEGDVRSAEGRIDQACQKYEDLLSALLPDVDAGPLVATTIRYVGISASIFALLTREGAVDDLTRAVARLEQSRGFVSSLLERRRELDADTDLQTAFIDLTTRLAAALDQLARNESKRADARFRSLGRTGHGDGGALSDYRRAAFHAAQAYALVQTYAYKVTELDAKLAQAELYTVLAREDRSADAPACASYRALLRDLAEARAWIPDAQKRRYIPIVNDFESRAERGARACGATPRIASGAVLLGVGAASLGIAAGLYAQYAGACAFGRNPVNGRSECLGIPIDGGDTDRYTAQVRASLGLAIAGGALLTAGAAILIPGLVQRKKAQPRRFLIAPKVDARHAGILLRINF